jgi:indolepyruvate ferredoxin oxidoreductase
MTSPPISLDDKYTQKSGHIYLSGTQALVRLPLVQRRRDIELGLNTSGFISGYRGSPLAGYDIELTRAQDHLDRHDIHFQPGLNEDLAATSIWGTQQLHLTDHKTRDGVFGIWYGKGPGVDRSMDVLRHANISGTDPKGGVLCIAGDDHGAKSSSVAHQSDHNFMSAFMPFLYPSGVHEFVEYGLLGLAMSRYSGCWVGFKAVGDTVESSATIDLAREARQIIMPQDFAMPPGGLSIRWPDAWREQDWRLQRYKGFAAIQFARANQIDRTIWDSPNPRFGIITSGKSYQDVRQALHEMDIDEERARDIGLRLYKVGMPWPLEPEGVRQFCTGLEEVLVVEEKREMIEHQLKWQLFNWQPEVRPRVVGKHDEHNNWLLPPENELSVGQIAHVIAERMARLYDSQKIRSKLAYFKDRETKLSAYAAPLRRTPYFCSGCPHNTSTKVPSGSRALAGIGCHIMAMNMDRSTETFTHMGGEGVPWIGQSPFTDETHIFANLGDGTYQHSGLLAIRAAVSAGVNITYKILYNDAVAMTGGQPVEGDLSVPDIVDQVLAEGVRRVAVVAEEPEAYARVTLPKSVDVLDRSDFPALQREFREIEGCTIIVYDQVCAAEKRRRRKRGLLPEPDTRVFINAQVCEGCGDCSVQSNCLSIEPLETEFGRKRVINQSTCNKDYSCVQGFCPSFVTLEGATLAKPKDLGALVGVDPLPDPVTAPLDHDYNILVTGIGGTGVLTIGAVLGMAAHIEGKESLIADMTGMAQKGGAVMSHVRIGRVLDTLRSPRVVTGGADLLLACDSVVASSPEAIDTLNPDRTIAIVNTDLTPVSEFVRHKNLDFHGGDVLGAIRANTRDTGMAVLPAAAATTAVTGDTIMTNMTMLGYAVQRGLIPISLGSIDQAIRLNGVAVDANLRAIRLGRSLAVDDGLANRILRPGQEPVQPPTLDHLIDRNVMLLKAYQNKFYAQRYLDLVTKTRNAEIAAGFKDQELTRAVATYAAKLMAYKDEYEVARLYTDGEFALSLKRQFDGNPKLKVHLAPPLMTRVDPATGRPKKRAFGRWVLTLFKALARLKGLRGTRFDPFGYTEERTLERRLVREYEARVDEMLETVTTGQYDLAVDILSLPDKIRGFGPVKLENIAKAAILETDLLEQYYLRRRDAA